MQPRLSILTIDQTNCVYKVKRFRNFGGEDLRSRLRPRGKDDCDKEDVLQEVNKPLNNRRK